MAQFSGKTTIEHKLGILILSIPFSETLIILTIIERHMIKMYRGADKSLARAGRKQATATKL